jgi:hypothetical protein
MIQTEQLPTATFIRLPKIKHGLIQKQTHDQIAKNCNVTRITIERDLTKWYATDDFYKWLHDLWIHLYSSIQNDELVFREVTHLIGKSMTQHIEAFSYEKIEGIVTVDTTDDEDAILSKAANILARKDRTRSLH